jgi:hypothetical protein
MTLARAEDPNTLRSDLQTDRYGEDKPHGEHLGIMKGASTSYERGGAAFTNRQLSQGHVIAKSSQNLSSLAFQGTEAPSFIKNDF